MGRRRGAGRANVTRSSSPRWPLRAIAKRCWHAVFKPKIRRRSTTASFLKALLRHCELASSRQKQTDLSLELQIFFRIALANEQQIVNCFD
jgi:hypothetical protein